MTLPKAIAPIADRALRSFLEGDNRSIEIPSGVVTWLRRIISKYSGGKLQIASDCLESCVEYLSSQEGRHALQAADAPLALLTAVAKAKVYKAHRHAQRLQLLGFLNVDIPSPEVSPPEQAISHEESDQQKRVLQTIQAELENLPERHRAVLRYYLVGIAPHEMAKLLGIQRVATRSRIHRALKKLSLLLRQSHPELFEPK